MRRGARPRPGPWPTSTSRRPRSGPRRGFAWGGSTGRGRDRGELLPPPRRDPLARPRIASAPSSAAGAAAAGRAPRVRPPPRRRPDSSRAIRAWSPTGSWPSWSSRASCENERLLNASDLLPAEFNVASWFVDRPVLEGRAGAPAFHCEGRVLSYGDVRELADRTGNALRELGVEMEQRVVMICLDTPEFLGTFWGAIKIGAVPVPVNTLLRAPDFRYVLDDSRAPVAVVSAPLLAEAAPALEGARYLRHVLVASGAPGPHLS